MEYLTIATGYVTLMLAAIELPLTSHRGLTVKALLEHATRIERDRKITYTWRGPVGDDGIARAVDLSIRHDKNRRAYFVTFHRYEVETRDGFSIARYGMFDGSMFHVGARPTARYNAREMATVFQTVIECDLTNDPGNAARFIAEAAALTMPAPVAECENCGGALDDEPNLCESCFAVMPMGEWVTGWSTTGTAVD